MELPHQRIRQIEYIETPPRCRPHCGALLGRKCQALHSAQRLSSTLNFTWSLGLGAHRALCGIQGTSNTSSDFKMEVARKRFNQQLCPSLAPAFLCISMLTLALFTPAMAKTPSAKLRPQDQGAALRALCKFYHINVPIDSRPASCAE